MTKSRSAGTGLGRAIGMFVLVAAFARPTHACGSTCNPGGPEEWFQLQPAGTPPAGLDGHNVVYDEPRRRMLVLFGNEGNGLWTLTLDSNPTWSRISPSGTVPTGRSSGTAVYDPVGDRVIVFGGNNNMHELGDVWELSLAGTPEWTQILPGGEQPAARFGHSAVYDPIGNRMIIHGGRRWYVNFRDDTWALSLDANPTWTLLSTAGPRLGYQSAIYDPAGRRMIVFGGAVQDGDYTTNDVWALSLGSDLQWSRFSPSGALPPERACHAAVYDPNERRMVIFGGAHDRWGYTMYNDSWSLFLDGPVPAWSLISPLGSPPSARETPGIRDAQGNRTVIFGGSDVEHLYNDVWSLRFRDPASAPVDEVRDSAVLRVSPNPTRGSLRIELVPPSRFDPTIGIYDPSGRIVRQLSGMGQAGGTRMLLWDGRDDRGRAVAGGIYFLRACGSGFRESSMLSVVR